MSEQADTMVLRSFHVPQALDDEMRSLAFALRCSKADLLRFFITNQLRDLKRQGDWKDWDDDRVAKVAQKVQEMGSSQAVTEAIRQDLARMGLAGSGRRAR